MYFQPCDYFVKKIVNKIVNNLVSHKSVHKIGVESRVTSWKVIVWDNPAKSFTTVEFQLLFLESYLQFKRLVNSSFLRTRK